MYTVSAWKQARFDASPHKEEKSFEGSAGALVFLKFDIVQGLYDKGVVLERFISSDTLLEDALFNGDTELKMLIEKEEEKRDRILKEWGKSELQSTTQKEDV